MSVADIIAVLYTEVLHYKADEPKWEERDRFILSKGHAGAAIYAALAESGFFNIDELRSHYANGSRLSGHVSHHLPGVDFSTGSLGHGLSAAAGMALAAKKNGKSHKVYVVLGDGECDEGQVWEGALSAAHLKLDNLIAFVDWNKQQLDGAVDDVLDLGDIGQKFEDFGWHVQKVNGHDVDALLEAVESAKAHKGQPSMIVLDTIKGNGCRLAMETFPCHHLKFKPEQIAPSVIEAEQVLAKAREALEVR